MRYRPSINTINYPKVFGTVCIKKIGAVEHGCYNTCSSKKLWHSIRDSYYVNAKRYLAKPLDVEELREALLYCYQETQRRTGGSDQLLLPTDAGQLRVSLRDIRYAESSGRHTCLHLTGGQEIVRLPLSRLAERLPESQFIYCHRTVLVNLAFVQRLRQRDLELTSGETLPVSRYRFAQVRQALLNLLDV